MSLVDLTAWTGNAIALLGIGYTWWANRGAKQAAAAANSRAQKSLEAAQEAAAAQQRMAEVMEKIYEAQESRPVAGIPSSPPAGRPSVVAEQPSSSISWQVTNVDGSRYLLTNAGSGTAYDVQLTTSGTARFDPPNEAEQDWPAGTSHGFNAVAAWHTGVPQLVVTWRDSAGGEQRLWKRVIPR